jgi:hypothetical protein
MICAEDCAGEQSFAFLIGEWYDGNYTDYTEGVLVPILGMPSVCPLGNNYCPISLANFKRRAGFKHYWSISPFFAFAGSQ